MNPSLTILIPTFNRSGLLTQAIESALSQDYPAFDVIVFDNASTDDTREVARRYAADPRFRYIRNEKNVGLIGNFRRCLEETKTDFFLYLSDDDYLIDTTYLTKAALLIRSNPGLVMVFAGGFILDAANNTRQLLDLPFAEVQEGKQVFLSRGTVKPLDFTLCNVLFHAETARSCDPFRNHLNVSADSELFLKMCLRGKVGVIRDAVSVYRVHGMSVTSRIRKDPGLLINNLDHLLQPLQDAKGRISQQELRDWETRLVLPELRSTLIACALYHRDLSNEAIESLKQKYPEEMEKLTRSWNFMLHFSFARRSRLLYWLISGSYRREHARERKQT